MPIPARSGPATSGPSGLAVEKIREMRVGKLLCWCHRTTASPSGWRGWPGCSIVRTPPPTRTATMSIKTIVGQLSGAVRGRTAIICDDMIRTGGSMLQTVDRCYQAGAVGVDGHGHPPGAGRQGQARALFKTGASAGSSVRTPIRAGRATTCSDLYSVAPLIADELKALFSPALIAGVTTYTTAEGHYEKGRYCWLARHGRLRAHGADAPGR